MVVIMKIQYLYVKKCPHWGGGLEVLKETLREANVEDKVEIVEIKNRSDAEKMDFIGSPTIRIEDFEIDRFPRELSKQIKTLKISGWRELLKSQKHKEKFSLACRKYKFKGKIFNYPSKEMIKDSMKRIYLCLGIKSCCQ